MRFSAWPSMSTKRVRAGGQAAAGGASDFGRPSSRGRSLTHGVRAQLDGHVVVAGEVQVGVVALRFCEGCHAAEHVERRLEIPQLQGRDHGIMDPGCQSYTLQLLAHFIGSCGNCADPTAAC
jgi:hypothetical protein